MPPDAPELEPADFVFDYIKDAPETLIRDAGDLDNKVVALFSAASVVLGLAAIGNVAGAMNPSHGVTALLVGAVLIYGGAATAALIHLWPVTLDRSLHADTLWSSSRANNNTTPEIKEFLLGSIEAAYAANKAVLECKAKTLAAVTVLTGLDVSVREVGNTHVACS
jgi:hypothetical protein